MLYSVHILSNDDKTEEMIIGENGLYFSGSPISIETDNEDTFQTIIKRSASINLVTKDYIGDKLFADNSLASSAASDVYKRQFIREISVFMLALLNLIHLASLLLMG